jgi:hypothetical protein
MLSLDMLRCAVLCCAVQLYADRSSLLSAAAAGCCVQSTILPRLQHAVLCCVLCCALRCVLCCVLRCVLCCVLCRSHASACCLLLLLAAECWEPVEAYFVGGAVINHSQALAQHL